MLKALLAELLARPAGAEAQYRRGTAARTRGDWEAAVRCYESALRADPGHTAAWNDLGIVHCERREFVQARRAFERALAAEPGHAVANLNLANLEREEFLDFSGAELHYRRALAAGAPPGQTLPGLGLSLQEQGRVDEAVACYQEAIRLDPADPIAREYLLFALNFLPDQTAQEVYTEHSRWAAAFAPTAARPPAQAGRRIRLGFVSGDFRNHSTAAFLLPLLRALDRTRFEVFCYSSCAASDGTTVTFKGLADHWQDIDAASDAEAAETIRGERIDILIDLSGHTRGGRPGIFSRRPAPMAATWLGYLNTTGLAAMDWRITDARADPPGASEAFHSEGLIRLPQTLWCFEPPADAPVLEPRQISPGDITFASCNHVAKLNDRVLQTWARLLREVSNSRLLVLGMPDADAAKRIAARLTDAGISSRRLELLGRLPRDRYWDALSKSDIALDPFPYNGGATTCECLWMGVPVISLAGRFGFARTGASILGCVGLADLVADSEDQYIAIACGLAGDADRLRGLRQGLRARMLASPLLDAGGFARAFESALAGALARIHA